MSLSINTNAISLNAQRNTVNNMQSLQTTMARLSSGLRINTAKDDAAGLAIAERLSSQARGMAMGLQNAADGMSLLEVADGAISSASDVLQRMRELAIRSLNGTNDTASRGNLNAEFTQLASELTRISNQTSFNGRAIIGASAGNQVFQVGAGGLEDDQDLGRTLPAPLPDVMRLHPAQQLRTGTGPGIQRRPGQPTGRPAVGCRHQHHHMGTGRLHPSRKEIRCTWPPDTLPPEPLSSVSSCIGMARTSAATAACSSASHTSSSLR